MAGRGIGRRALLGAGAGALGSGLGALLGCGRTEAESRTDAGSERGGRPELPSGVQVGEVGQGSAVVWSRADRPSRLVVDWSVDPRLRAGVRSARGGLATAETDFTARVALSGLAPGARVHYRIRFASEDEPGVFSEPLFGSFRAAPARPSGLKLAWSGDLCGQGFGIDPSRGGIPIFSALRREAPDLFVLCGDVIYADQPLRASIELADGSVWKNLIVPEKLRRAESLADFRANYAYNLRDAGFRAFLAEVPVFFQWDDHEVENNWSPGPGWPGDAAEHREDLRKAALGRRAFLEYAPAGPAGPLHRSFSYGPELDLFLLDGRGFRAPNDENREERASIGTAMLGRAQLDWLAAGLSASRATWKIISSPSPLALVIGTDKARDGFANGAGPPLGREHELAELLSGLRARGVSNVVFISADVHYAAAHRFDPSRAARPDFDPFWAFVAGPLHAKGFGPAPLDPTFGPELVYASVDRSAPSERPPMLGYSSYGTLTVDARTRALSVALRRGDGSLLFEQVLRPRA